MAKKKSSPGASNGNSHQPCHHLLTSKLLRACHKTGTAFAMVWNQSLQRNWWWLKEAMTPWGDTDTTLAPQTELYTGEIQPAISIQPWPPAKAKSWQARGVWQLSLKQSQENCHTKWKPKITCIARTSCKALIYLMNYLQAGRLPVAPAQHFHSWWKQLNQLKWFWLGLYDLSSLHGGLGWEINPKTF